MRSIEVVVKEEHLADRLDELERGEGGGEVGAGEGGEDRLLLLLAALHQGELPVEEGVA